MFNDSSIICFQSTSINLNTSDPIIDIQADTGDIRRTVVVIWIAIASLGLLLNFAQIIWITTRKHKSVIDVFIVSLAIVDLQTCCVNIPLEVTDILNIGDWSVFGNNAGVICRFHWYFKHGSVVTGSIIICLIAVSRYIAVSDPMRKAKEKCNQMCINSVLAVMTWLISIALVVPIVLSTTSVTRTYMIADDLISDSTLLNGSHCYKRSLSCQLLDSGIGINIYGSVLFFVAPTLIMCFTYTSLIRILIKRKRNEVLAYKGNAKHFRKSIVNSVLGLAYIILVAPKGIYDVLQLPKVSRHEQMTPHQISIDRILYVIASLVVISNPVIYSFLTPRFFKFVEIHSHRRSSMSDHHSRLWSESEWASSSRHHNSMFLSHENLIGSHSPNYRCQRHRSCVCRMTYANMHHNRYINKPKAFRQITEMTILESEENSITDSGNLVVESSYLVDSVRDLDNCTFHSVCPIHRGRARLGTF